MNEQVWTVLKLLNWTQEFFEKKHIDGARLDAEILLARVLKCERIFLYVNFEKPLTKDELAEYKALIVKRAAGQSIAYILGEKQFMDFNLKVNSHVLVPRPETELLVEFVLEKHTNDGLKVLDMCTGSGAIGIALAKYHSNWEITSTDISAEALGVAKENATAHQVVDRMSFVQADMFKGLPAVKYDIIVANPPYIPHADKVKLAPEVLCEPHTALFAEDSGLYFYKIMAMQAANYLDADGAIFLEYGVGQSQDIVEMFGAQGYGAFEVRKDYAGIERMLRISKN